LEFVPVTQKIDGYKSSQVLLTTGAKNAKGVKNAAHEKSNAGESAAESAAADHVTLTDSAKSLQKIEEALANAPVVDSAKVEAVKLSLANGSYQVDSQRVADKILLFDRHLN
jgi:negative regulator of flagellin synthesis FlgM